MNTSEIYAQLIIENIVKKYLELGQVPTLQQIEDEFAIVSSTQNLSSSDFTSEEWVVARKEESSATKFNEMNNEINTDLNVLYKSLFKNSERATSLFNRWQTKAQSLENRLRNLESKISRILSTNNSIFNNSLSDKFVDTVLIDQERSTGITIDLGKNIVLLDKENSDKSISTDRLFLNQLRSDQVIFTSLTRTNVISVTNINGSEPRFAFKDLNQFWKTHIVTSKKVSPVTAELLLKLDSPVLLSNIEILLHSSQNNSVTQVTPLYSIDGVTFFQIPTINTIGAGIDKINFSFPEIEFQFLKLIFQKTSHDFIDNNFFVYEFGAKEIALFNHVFSLDTGTLKSKSLSILDSNNELVQFNKVALETCEAITEDLRIDYQVSVAKNSNGNPLWLVTSGLSTEIDLDGEDQRLWFPLSPVNRTVATYPKLLDLSTLTRYDKSDISISYDRDGIIKNPGENYTLLQQSGDILSYSTETATDQRYIFSRNNQKLLNLQIDLDVHLNIETLSLWRNVGQKGIEVNDTTQLVRSTQAGWEYVAPYYYTTVKIKSLSGMTIDVGNNSINIDEVNYTGIIDGLILTPGIHKIRIHKDYWNHIPPGASTLSELKSLDILYPFNQKLLIEGYEYDSTFIEPKVYTGVDFFSGILMEKVSIFDLINNINENDFNKFSLDVDITEATPFGPSNVFVVNVNNSIADFVNEKFMLEFDLTDDLFSFIALKAEFRTNINQVSPILDEYIIKLGF